VDPSITYFLQERIDAGDFPSAVYLVADKGEIVFQDALGLAVVEPERIEARIDTIYDVASLTKVLVTGLLTAMLVESGQVSLADAVTAYLSEFHHDQITVENLIAHTSGLQAWKPLYLSPGAPPIDSHNYMGIQNAVIHRFVLQEIAGVKPERPVNTGVVYSDLNFIPLGAVLDNFGLQAMWSNVVARLQLTRTFFGGVETLRKEIAASEKGNRFELEMCVEQGYYDPTLSSFNGRSPFRNETIWGEVHDCNAYFMGGVAGHAGLFSTIEETFKIAQQFLPNYTRLLMPETCELFRTNLTKGMNEDRSFAFQLASTIDSTAGTKMSPESFGHTGFTGTSLWIDPVKERIFILFTNRTHHHGLPFTNINSVRRRFHDLAIELLDNG
jgi:CubicO group peptidase (beta-lactamase class C family)